MMKTLCALLATLALASGLLGCDASKTPFTYETRGEGVVVTGIKDDQVVDLKIPEIIDGKPVVAIGGRAFCERPLVRMAIIPETVEEIEGGAFLGCTGMSSATLPKNLKRVGDGAFYDCKNLVSLTVYGTLTEIGEKAFPKSVELIGPPETVAQKWAEENDVRYLLLSELEGAKEEELK